jgi:DNA-binding CsgD family transcriptional regulator
VIGKLTTRERDVIRLVSVGASNKEVADRLGLRASTVKSHVSSILWKLEAGSRTEAAIIALRAGLVEAPALRQGTASRARQLLPPRRDPEQDADRSTSDDRPHDDRRRR